MPLLLILLVVLRESDVLAVSNLVLPVIRLEVVEDVLPELQVDVDRDLMRVTRVHLAKLVVDVKVLVWE